MKAMVLAAGRGERMRPLTTHAPKPLLQAAGRPLVEHVLLALRRQGFFEVILNVAYLGQMIIDHLGDGSRLGLRLTYSDEGPEPIGTAAGVRRALPMLGEEPFLVTSADVVTGFAYGSLAPPGGRDLATLMVVPVSKTHPRADFFLRDDRLALEPPGLPVVYGNSGMFAPPFFSPPGQEQEQAMGPLLRRAIGEDRSGAMLHEGFWVNVGTPDALAWLDAHGPAGRHD